MSETMLGTGGVMRVSFDWQSQKGMLRRFGVTDGLRFLLLTIGFALLVMVGGASLFLLEYHADDLRILEDQQQRDRVREVLNNDESLFRYIQRRPDAFVGKGDNEAWSPLNSCFFAFAIVTTVGLGSFSPTTAWGQIFLLAFGMLGLPIAYACLVSLADSTVRLCSRVAGRGTADTAFDLFDTEHRGSLGLGEFQEALVHMGFKCSKQGFKRLCAEIDIDGSGSVDREEFAEAVALLRSDGSGTALRRQRLRVLVVCGFMWLSAFACVFSYLEEWTLLQACYFGFVTITTIGLGDFSPQTLAVRTPALNTPHAPASHPT
jgi:hypothetical protein